MKGRYRTTKCNIMTEFNGKNGTCFVDLSQVASLEATGWYIEGGLAYVRGTKIHLKSGQSVVVHEDAHAIKEST